MPQKRSLEPDTSLEWSARKRRNFSTPLPVTPASSRLSFSTPLKTPYTPYPPHPSDSPSNPFGRKRIKHLIRTLPRITPFSKHLPLRFQLIREGPPTSFRQGGVYRVTQVPLSYTLAHLRCLIAFLFGGVAGQAVLDEHLFEVKKDVTVYGQLYKPGQIKSGQTWAKLSSSKNPYRYRLECLSDEEEETEEEDEDERDELSSQPERADGEQSGDEECEDWKWEDEEEFTVGHVWSKGPDLARGIVYHHSRTTQIHITINQSVIPKRKGKSNTPYVFSARGRVWLSPLPLPQPVFSKSAKNVSSLPRRPNHRRVIPNGTDRDADGDTEEDDEDEYTEDLNLQLDPNSWNKPEDAFAKFLVRYMGPILRYSSPHPSDNEADHVSEGESLLYPSTPRLTRSSSVPSSPLPVSSPPCSSSRIRIAGFFSDTESDWKSEAKLEDEGGYVTLSLPALTPFPPKTRPIRKRMEMIEKRMGKIKNGKWLCARDEKPEEEKDELTEDGGGKGEGVAVDAATEVSEGDKKLPEDWDPFGDEEEL